MLFLELAVQDFVRIVTLANSEGNLYINTALSFHSTDISIIFELSFVILRQKKWFHFISINKCVLLYIHIKMKIFVCFYSWKNTIIMFGLLIIQRERWKHIKKKFDFILLKANISVRKSLIDWRANWINVINPN